MFPKYLYLFCFFIYFIICVPEYEISKKVQNGIKTVTENGAKRSYTVKKVFITIIEGCYVYRKKKVIGKRENGRYKVLFVCSDCSKLDKLVYVYSTVEVHNIDHEEDDEYVVDGLPLPDDHYCQPHGVEDMVKQFNKELRNGVHLNPVRPLPELYEATR